jgi:mono/diheme cytochrome c family protein
MTTKMLIGVMFVLIFTSAGASAQTQLSTTDRGQRIYQRNCLHCHGVRLDGKGPTPRPSACLPPTFIRTSPVSKTTPN